MTRSIYDNARILADELAPSLKHEYYATEQSAQRVADAMSMATGSCWLVSKDKQQPACYWISRQGL